MSNSTPTIRAPRSASQKLLAGLKWIADGFGIARYLHGRSARRHVDEIVVYSVHNSFYLWPVILLGFIGSAAVRRHPESANAWGWLYIWTFAYTLTAILFDLNTIRILLWSIIVGFFWLAFKYLEDWKHIYILSALVDYFRNQRPALQPGFIFILSWFMLLFWVGAIFRSFGHGRKSFSPNGIEEWYMGEGREITDRSGLHFVSRYPNVLQFLLGFGAGNLQAIDGAGRIVKQWDHIVFLFFIWKRLDEILHQRAAVMDTSPPEESEADEPEPEKRAA